MAAELIWGEIMAVVTALKPDRRRAGFVEVVIDGESIGAVPEALSLQYAPEVGAEVAPSGLSILRAAAQLGAARATADSFLAYRPRSESEVRRRLQRAGHDSATIDAALASLRLEGLLDDARFGALWVESRQSFSPRSSTLLAMELRGKGLDRDQIDAVLEHAEVDDDRQALAAARTRLRSLSSLPEPDFRRRLTAYLGRRGFAFTTADRAARVLWDEMHPE